MKKPKKLNFIIDTGVYPVEIMVSLGETDIEFKRKIDKFVFIKDHRIGMRGSGRFVSTNSGRYYIRLKNYPEYSWEFGCLSHEILHAVFATLNYIGVQYKKDFSEESYTYLMGYITDKIYKKLGF
jgi:hypothetical protein